MNRFLDVALILQADHGFNASTFTTRVVASTRASIYSAVAAGVCALSGPLHGGANAQVMKNLLDVNDPDSVEAWVAEQFKHGRRVSGMGHAVYKTMDPRAAILQSMAHRVMDVRPEFRWYEMTERMIIATQEHFRIARGGRSIRTSTCTLLRYHARASIQISIRQCSPWLVRRAGPPM